DPADLSARPRRVLSRRQLDRPKDNCPSPASAGDGQRYPPRVSSLALPRRDSSVYRCKRLGRMVFVTGLVTVLTGFVTVVTRLVTGLVTGGTTVCVTVLVRPV